MFIKAGQMQSKGKAKAKKQLKFLSIDLCQLHIIATGNRAAHKQITTLQSTAQ
jgi:hypothetical protein